MDIFIASDHAGFELKQYIISSISKISWIDLGCDSLESVDYPIYSFKLAQSVVNKKSSKGTTKPIEEKKLVGLDLFLEVHDASVTTLADKVSSLLP